MSVRSLGVAAIRVSRRLVDGLLLALIIIVLGTLAVGRLAPAITGGTTFVVGGGSMEPTIPFGSAALVTPVAATDLRVGDVVSLRVGPAKTVFTHRITRLVPRSDGLWLESRGDANKEPDPALIPASDVIGRLALSIPYAGYPVAILGSLLGIVLALGLASFLVAAAWLLESVEQDHRLELDRRAARRGSERGGLTHPGERRRAIPRALGPGVEPAPRTS